MSIVPSADSAPGKPKWYRPTLPKFLLAVLVMQGVLFLSTHYRWFWFNEKKGWTVLITVAATVATVLLVAAFVLVSRFFKSKAQFSLLTLLLIAPVIAIPFGWLAREMDQALQQREIVGVSFETPGYGEVYRMRLVDLQGVLARRSAAAKAERSVRADLEKRLRDWLGEHFFRDINSLSVSKPEVLDRIHMLKELRDLTCEPKLQVDTAKLRGLNHLHTLNLDHCRIEGARLEPLRDLPALQTLRLSYTNVSDGDLEPLGQVKQLKQLWLIGTGVTDVGLEHIRGLTQLELLELKGTRVTGEGAKKLQSELPRCLIVY